MTDDTSRPVATSPDSEFTLTIEDAIGIYAPDFPGLREASNVIAPKDILNAAAWRHHSAKNILSRQRQFSSTSPTLRKCDLLRPAATCRDKSRQVPQHKRATDPVGGRWNRPCNGWESPVERQAPIGPTKSPPGIGGSTVAP
jgi:hypothetical protein